MVRTGVLRAFGGDLSSGFAFGECPLQKIAV